MSVQLNDHLTQVNTGSSVGASDLTPADEARMIRACGVLLRWMLSVLPDPEPTGAVAQQSEGDHAA